MSIAGGLVGGSSWPAVSTAKDVGQAVEVLSMSRSREEHRAPCVARGLRFAFSLTRTLGGLGRYRTAAGSAEYLREGAGEERAEEWPDQVNPQVGVVSAHNGRPH